MIQKKPSVLSGRVGIEQADLFHKLAKKKLAGKTDAKAKLDLSEVTSLDNSSFQIILAFRAELKRLGFTPELTGVPEDIRDLGVDL